MYKNDSYDDTAINKGIAQLAGEWGVTTSLVTASSPVNSQYREGDLRNERWVFTESGEGILLTSHAGTILGRVFGNAFAFNGVYDTGLGIQIKVQISGTFDTESNIFGTINADYFSSTFGQKVGMDAWTFKGIRG